MKCRLVVAIALPIIMTSTAAPAQDADDGQVEALRAEIQELRRMLPSQSHTMMDVDYHFANLWFAGQAGNWPLAQFYLNETRNHIGWAVRVRPVRPTSRGDIDLSPIFEGMQASSLSAIGEAIEGEDLAAFESGYRTAISECHSCHVAAEKPYLLPHIPESPATHMIQMEPGESE
jgi:hypothetical protein